MPLALRDDVNNAITTSDLRPPRNDMDRCTKIMKNVIVPLAPRNDINSFPYPMGEGANKKRLRKRRRFLFFVDYQLLFCSRDSHSVE